MSKETLVKLKNFIHHHLEISSKSFNETEKILYKNNNNIEEKIEASLDMSKFKGYSAAMKDILCFLKGLEENQNTTK